LKHPHVSTLPVIIVKKFGKKRKKKKTLSEEFRGFGEEVESEIFREEKVRY
jgi:hypothetical protein